MDTSPPRQRPVHPALRALDNAWLALLALVVPFIGIGPGSSCEGCPQVVWGLLFIYAGVGATSAVYLWSLRRSASEALAVLMAAMFVPVTFLVVVTGLVIAA